MKKVVLCLSLVLAMPAIALSAERRDGAYYCAEKFAGGIAYNNGEWRGAAFNAKENFVLKLSQTKPPAEEQDPNYQDRYYIVTITVEGRSSYGCLAGSKPPFDLGKPPFLDDDAILRCGGGLSVYIFNFDNHRFIKIYTAGYVDSSNNDSPNVAGGLCTKISQ